MIHVVVLWCILVEMLLVNKDAFIAATVLFDEIFRGYHPAGRTLAHGAPWSAAAWLTVHNTPANLISGCERV